MKFIDWIEFYLNRDNFIGLKEKKSHVLKEVTQILDLLKIRNDRTGT